MADIPDEAGPAAGARSEPDVRAPGFRDIVEFVERTTARIWDDKNPGLIADWYTPTTVVHTSDGDIFGQDAVIASAVAKMAAFPDIKDHVEQTVWTQRDGAFHTSMRWTWTARNTGWSVWGPPTGRSVVTRGIANCVVRDGRYVEEWVAYDELATLRQLGVPVAAELARLGPSGAGEGASGDTDRRVGQAEPDPLPPADPGDLEGGLRFRLHEIWNRRMFGQMEQLYAAGATFHGPDGRELCGVGEIRQHFLALLAMLPDGRLFIDDVYSSPGTDGPTAAVRWTLVGHHGGPSAYGPPSGRRVRLLGLDHLRLVDGAVVEQWSVYSELSLLRQIMPRGSHVPDAGDQSWSRTAG